MVERHPYKVDVAGSNPVLPTILIQVTEITVKIKYELTLQRFTATILICYMFPYNSFATRSLAVLRTPGRFPLNSRQAPLAP